MLLKIGTILKLQPEMSDALRHVESVSKLMGFEAIITSANDREHSAGSAHYFGLAIDLRIRDLNAQDQKEYNSRLTDSLRPEYKVLLKPRHIHIEYILL